MSIFDPPEKKAKSVRRGRIVYPEGTNKRMFAILYFASILFWLFLFALIAGLAVFLVLPLFGLILGFVVQLVIVIALGGLGALAGMFIGSALVSAVIAEGIKEGDIEYRTLPPKADAPMAQNSEHRIELSSTDIEY
ncbi:hypothetical protein GF391_00240 [Candidatus Uhrbacteria bacterium]|nr:hypothetical protein [Candidatus Uhrbacteria bacterium]